MKCSTKFMALLIFMSPTLSATYMAIKKETNEYVKLVTRGGSQVLETGKKIEFHTVFSISVELQGWRLAGPADFIGRANAELAKIKVVEFDKDGQFRRVVSPVDVGGGLLEYQLYAPTGWVLSYAICDANAAICPAP